MIYAIQAFWTHVQPYNNEPKSNLQLCNKVYYTTTERFIYLLFTCIANERAHVELKFSALLVYTSRWSSNNTVLRLRWTHHSVSQSVLFILCFFVSLCLFSLWNTYDNNSSLVGLLFDYWDTTCAGAHMYMAYVAALGVGERGAPAIAYWYFSCLAFAGERL